ncbi:hypothetical protein TNIN_203321 [Trichonephila inaurata madagascariensis]|uniref:Uncharacterized protein n=1 Tax=Trichonephila inaurata madagascariensis TaxID=2747483 RepID=A0A8X6WMV6_9ARAC|nr:hypothetical protein TNIN_203321 [Trichonephila inaurata madagascariensis]
MQGKISETAEDQEGRLEYQRNVTDKENAVYSYNLEYKSDASCILGPMSNTCQSPEIDSKIRSPLHIRSVSPAVQIAPPLMSPAGGKTSPGRTTPAPIAVPSNQYSGMSLSASDVIVPVPSKDSIFINEGNDQEQKTNASSSKWMLDSKY